MRIVRIILGILIIIQGVVTKEWTFLAIGAVFSLMAVFNVGCCGRQGCNTTNKKSTNSQKDISYDEVH